MTFRYSDPKNNKVPEEFVLPKLTHQFVNSDERRFLDPEDKDFINSRWCYDTPGVVHHDQVFLRISCSKYVFIRLILILPSIRR